jgi:hypothetical protein
MDLLQKLDELDRQGVWVLDMPRMALLFPDESRETLRTSLARHCKTGLLQRFTKGVFVNPRALSIPEYYTLLHATPMLHPLEFSYLSLEAVLSDAGWISQIPMCETFMTTGRSGVFYTCYGRLEFTHTESQDSSGIYFNSAYGCWVATPERAYTDLKHVGRCLDLVEIPDEEDMTEMKAAHVGA